LRGKLKHSCVGKRFLFDEEAHQDVIPKLSFVDLASVEANHAVAMKHTFVEITFVLPIVLENSSHFALPMWQIVAPVALVN